MGEVEFPLSFSKIGLGNFTKNKITNVSPAGTTKSLVLIISQSSPAAYIMGNIYLSACVPTSWFERFPNALLGLL